jgi:tetratricopeptide (TPR) repeat protein
MLVALAAEDVPAARISIFAVAPVSAALFVVALRLLMGDWELERARQDLNAGNGPSAVLRYSRVRGFGLYADIWYSNQMAKEARKAHEILVALTSWQQALESGIRATKTADDPQNAWYNLSSLHARENQFTSTEQALRQAILISPTWFKPHWTLAQVLMTRGRLREAEAEAKLAANLNAGKNPEVARTLAEIQAKDK